jgi:regulator of sigma D
VPGQPHRDFSIGRWITSRGRGQVAYKLVIGSQSREKFRSLNGKELGPFNNHLYSRQLWSSQVKLFSKLFERIFLLSD